MITKEIIELERAIVCFQRERENLLDYLTDICSIINYQCSLKHQDEWLERMISLGYYKREKEK